MCSASVDDHAYSDTLILIQDGVKCPLQHLFINKFPTLTRESKSDTKSLWKSCEPPKKFQKKNNKQVVLESAQKLLRKKSLQTFLSLYGLLNIIAKKISSHFVSTLPVFTMILFPILAT